MTLSNFYTLHVQTGMGTPKQQQAPAASRGKTRKCSRANKENEDPEAKVMQTCQQLSCLGMALIQASAYK